MVISKEVKEKVDNQKGGAGRAAPKKRKLGKEVGKEEGRAMASGERA